MTAVPHKEMELEDERTAQKQYRKVLQEKAKAPVAFSVFVEIHINMYSFMIIFKFITFRTLS